jgi:hypothetical protein
MTLTPTLTLTLTLPLEELLLKVLGFGRGVVDCIHARRTSNFPYPIQKCFGICGLMGDHVTICHPSDFSNQIWTSL